MRLDPKRLLTRVHLQVAEKVKHFFFEYARNRHKMTTLTPSYHAVCLAIVKSPVMPVADFPL